jgi:hypothetical protein
MNTHLLEKTIELRINRVKKRFHNVEHYNSKEHTFHGGWTQGYWEGQLCVLEDLQDLVVDLREEELRIREKHDELTRALCSDMYDIGGQDE